MYLHIASAYLLFRAGRARGRDLPMAEYIGLYRTFSIIGHRHRPPIVFTFLAEGLAEGLAQHLMPKIELCFKISYEFFLYKIIHPSFFNFGMKIRGRVIFYLVKQLKFQSWKRAF